MNSIAFTAPHELAAEAGMAILEEGGNAVDAMIAAASMIAVQYPHMNGLGGDGFWLIQRKGEKPFGIDACGRAAMSLTAADYEKKGLSAIPSRGCMSAITMAGTVSGWQKARECIAKTDELLPLSRVFESAMHSCRAGIAVTKSLATAIELGRNQFSNIPEASTFRKLFAFENIHRDKSLIGNTLKNTHLGQLFEQLARSGLNDFYQGEIAEALAGDLNRIGSPIALADFHRHQSEVVSPLSVTNRFGTLFNLPAPTQGIASLLILAIYDVLYSKSWGQADHVHMLVEATKLAFEIRDREVIDPSLVNADLRRFLSSKSVAELAGNVDIGSVRAWPSQGQLGDTVWMGAVDKQGTMVSFIQSLYWEFGSGCVLPSFGLVWNNRGVSFSLEEGHPNYLRPAMKPFHTLNPALAVMDDGSRMVYGTMGGEGQPQTQAAIYSRALYQGSSLEQAIAEDRWLLGRTWGDVSTDLKLESSLYGEIGDELAARGHIVKKVAAQNEAMGHAGAIRIFSDGRIEAASDPRSDGKAIVK